MIFKFYENNLMLIDCRRQVFEYLFEKKDALLIILPVGYGKSLFYH